MVVVRKVFGNEYRLTARDSKCVLCTRWRGWGDVMRYKGRGNWYHCRLCSKSVHFYSSFPLYGGLIRHLKKNYFFLSLSRILFVVLSTYLSVCLCLSISIHSISLSIYISTEQYIYFILIYPSAYLSVLHFPSRFSFSPSYVYGARLDCLGSLSGNRAIYPNL